MQLGTFAYILYIVNAHIDNKNSERSEHIKQIEKSTRQIENIV